KECRNAVKATKRRAEGSKKNTSNVEADRCVRPRKKKEKMAIIYNFTPIEKLIRNCHFEQM
ncbi:MAG: hypothetical protein IJZ22_09265, partial [Bacteroidaceae bacterium]|nr:hypothetical protein [Bacteroidaceae bacterium]